MAVSLPTVLVTGANSFLGTHLARTLSAVTTTHVLVRDGSDVSELNYRSGPHVHHHDGSFDVIRASFEASRPQLVVHLATRYLRSHAPDDIDDLIDANIRFGTNVLEAMVATECDTLIVAGSHFQLYEGNRPLNLYAATKDAFGAIVRWYRDAKGIHDTVVTLYEVYGPDDPRHKIVNVLARAARTHEVVPIPADDPLLDLVYVTDATRALVTAAALAWQRSIPAGSTFSASSGRQTSISELIHVVETASGAGISTDPGAYSLPERSIIVPSVGPLLPDWRPQVSLEEGIRRVLESVDVV